MKAKITRRQFIKSTAQAGVILGIVGGSTWGGGCASGKSFDLIIRNGMVVDGMADKSYQADVGIIGERIEAVGNLRKAQAATVFDATGRTITPGFIDIHSHTGPELLINPRAESKVRQGVTTELGGNCGGSSFPLKRELQDEERKWAEKVGLEIDWVDLEGFYTRLAKNGIAVNFATLVGQGTIRSRVMEQERREPTPEEIEQMKVLVAEAMEQGAFGLSTGLEYTPSGFAATPEVIELCRVAARYGGFYATHIRSEADQLLEALGEAIFIAESAKISLQISHLKAAGRVNW
ncbi:MAG: amidohydrolase family protein, partial [Candidatus Aminicenantes bacterium]|nr:amidohydrolase family protein [Candidatus Aminicenantes bacterium]